MPTITTPEEWQKHRVTILRVLDKDYKEWRRALKDWQKKSRKNPQNVSQHPGVKPPKRDPDRGRAINQMKQMMFNIDKSVSDLQYWKWMYSVKPTPENQKQVDKAQRDFEEGVKLFNRFAMEHKLRFTQ